MSVFQRLRSMPVGDILHRGLLYSLVGISGWGIYTMGAVHFDILKRGRGKFYALAAHEAEDQKEIEQVQRENALAEAASNTLSRKA